MIDSGEATMRAHNPLSVLTPYELAHLPAHLASAGRDSEVHRLLALSTDPPGGGNAWFVAKESVEATQGFLDDLLLASRLAAASTTTAVRDGAPAVTVAFEARYALMAAAVTNLASALPAELLVRLVVSDRWGLTRALAYARHHPNLSRRAHALALLTEHVPADDRRHVARQVLDSLAELRDQVEHKDPDVSEGAESQHIAEGTALMSVAPFLASDDVELALSLARTIPDIEQRCAALAAIATRMDGASGKRVIGEALEAARANETAGCVGALSAVLPDAAIPNWCNWRARSSTLISAQRR